MAEVLYEVTDGVARITLNRPNQRNAVNVALTNALRDAVGQAEDDTSVRCTVLTGAGAVFCAGMDLKAHLAGATQEVLFGEYGFAGFVARQRVKPVIAAVEGAALAGGFEIMLACDLVVAGQGAVFGLPEPKIGLIAGAGGAVRLAQRIPRVLANEVLLTGETITADTAQTWGLVNRVVPNGTAVSAAMELAADIAQNAPGAVQEGLRLSQRIFEAQDVPNWQANDEAIARIGASDDAREGVSAFLEKRAPRWKG